MSKNKIIQQIEEAQLKADVPEFGSGDTLVVQVRVAEGNRQRLQAFEGVVIGKRNRGLNSAFTLRKISHGVGVERTFQTHSPLIDSITVKRRGDVRQAKLYYLRERSGRSHQKRGLAARPSPHTWKITAKIPANAVIDALPPMVPPMVPPLMQ